MIPLHREEVQQYSPAGRARQTKLFGSAHDLWLGSLSRLRCGRDFPIHTSRASVYAIPEAPDAEALTQTAP